MADFEAFLRDPDARPRMIVVARPRDPDTMEEVPVYLADGSFVTEPGDDPPNIAMKAVLKEFPSYVRRAADDLRLRGGMRSEGGSFALINSGREDGLADLVWRGAPVTVLFGDLRWPIADFVVVHSGSADTPSTPEAEMVVPIRSPRLRLEVPVSTALFGGTGGLDGRAELKDAKKPVCVGEVFNVEPVYVGIVGGLYFYQVHDGPIEDIPVVRSKGGRLTKVAGTPAAGQYQVDTANGGFYTPVPEESGVVTCDVLGDKTGGVFVSSAAEVYERLVTERAGFLPSDFEPGTVAALHGKNAAPVGFYDRAGTSIVADEARALMDTVGALDHFTRAGLIRMVRFEGPAATADGAISEGQILQCDRLATADPASRLRMGAARNWRVLDEGEAGQLADDREAVITEWLWSDFDTGWAGIIDNEHEPFETRFRYSADADAEIARLGALFGQPAKVISVQIKTMPYALDVGRTLTVTHSRHGLQDGRRGWVIGIDENLDGKRAVVYLWMEVSSA